MLTTYFVISKVYNDAEELEKLLLAKHAELGPPPEAEEAASVHESATSPSKSSVRSLTLAVKNFYIFVCWPDGKDKVEWFYETIHDKAGLPVRT